jgi:hypothetical protein
MQLNTSAIFAMFAVLSVASSMAAAEESELDSLISDGTVTLDFRYRYEFVDQDGFDRNANASTLRTRLGFQSGVYRGFDFNIEVNDVRHVLSNNFDAGGGTTPDRSGVYPVVPDPKGTRLNQGYLRYRGIEDWSFVLGRQRINLDNQRFVGAVGWRQTEQVYDAAQVAWSNDLVSVSYTYVQWVRRIFGDSSAAGKDRQDGTMLLNAAVDTPFGKLVGYYYGIDSRDTPTFSTDTLGIRLSGKQALGSDWSVRYEGEYATQRDAADNPADFRADYFHIEAAALVGMLDFGAGWELLGGDAGTPVNEAFRTPLATLHAFNGWADQFLTTPAAGLSDLYAKFSARPGDVIVQARYHRFEADDGGQRYGDELDLQVGYKFTNRFRGDLYFADFDGRDGFVDVTKFWVQLLFKL